jgi:hypothetical protein
MAERKGRVSMLIYGMSDVVQCDEMNEPESRPRNKQREV